MPRGLPKTVRGLPLPAPLATGFDRTSGRVFFKRWQQARPKQRWFERPSGAAAFRPATSSIMLHQSMLRAALA